MSPPSPTEFPRFSQTPEATKVASSLVTPDAFWVIPPIDNLRWNKTYPYRLRLWIKKGKSWEPDETTIPPFTLPIPPESLVISTPFAINTIVTLGGIVEEHNGAPLRTISISGTTGVLPLKGNSVPIASGQAPLLNSIFTGTTSAISTLQSSISKPEPTNLVTDDEIKELPVGFNSGYVKFKELRNFLENYVTLKKTSAGRDSILAVELWKDQDIYFVSPASFELRRSAASPLEYQYSMTFKAWKRVAADKDTDPTFTHQPAARSPSKMYEALNTIEKARASLDAVKDVLVGIRADIRFALMTPLRETALFIKEAIGVASDATDFPSNIVKDFKKSILEAGGFASGISSQAKTLTQTGDKIDALVRELGIQSGKLETLNGDSPALKTTNTAGAAPANSILDNPDENYPFFKTQKPGLLNLPPHTRRQIEEEKQRVRNLKREDFEKHRDSIADFLRDYEAATGVSNTTFDSTYGTPIRNQSRANTDADFDVIFTLNALIVEFNRLAASSTINLNHINSIDYIAGLASRSGIAFKTPMSKFLVPFPYGYTLEQLSLKYLKTPDRWHEIAALNGLQSPYVDEVGFTLPLLTNGSKNTVVVSDVSNLFINQSVWISSSTTARSARRITDIKSLSSGTHLVTVSGDSDLEKYVVSYSSILQGFLPNTINSQMSIYIPSDTEADESDFGQKSIPGVDQFDPLVRVGGVDLLLDQKNDLVVTPDGDSRLAVGLTNIVQKVRLAVSTLRGSLLHHPDYGFPIQPGMSVSDSSAQDILNQVRGLFSGDPTFNGVESAYVVINAGAVTVSMSVKISGVTQTIPITIEIPAK
jgi:hypothetical protein